MFVTMKPTRGNSSPLCHSTLVTTRRARSQLPARYQKSSYRITGRFGGLPTGRISSGAISYCSTFLAGAKPRRSSSVLLGGRPGRVTACRSACRRLTSRALHAAGLKKVRDLGRPPTTSPALSRSRPSGGCGKAPFNLPWKSGLVAHSHLMPSCVLVSSSSRE